MNRTNRNCILTDFIMLVLLVKAVIVATNLLVETSVDTNGTIHHLNSNEYLDSDSTSPSVTHEYFKVDAEKVNSLDYVNINANNNNNNNIRESSSFSSSFGKINQTDKKTSHLMSMMRSLLKKEIRKLKSSITDSVMEEVINYYGKKLELNDALKEDIEILNKKYSSLNENLNLLSQNYKTILKNHKNLVDIVRNNIINAKKEKDIKQKSAKESSTGQQYQSSSGNKLGQNLNYKNISNSNANTRAISDNLKKKSIESGGGSNKKLNNQVSIFVQLENTNLPNGSIYQNITSFDPNLQTIDMVRKLKIELLNDLETKYSNFIDEKLANVIVKNLNDSITTYANPNQNVNDAHRKIVIRHDDNNLNPNDSNNKKQNIKQLKFNLENKNENEYYGSEAASKLNSNVPKKEIKLYSNEVKKQQQQHQQTKILESLVSKQDHGEKLAEKNIPESISGSSNLKNAFVDSSTSGNNDATLNPPNDCTDLKESGFVKDGIYKIFMLNSNKSFDVYCEFENDLAWTVLQRRHDGSISFHQNWKSYKNGFGNMFNNGEFWLGLDNMHSLTSQHNYSLQVVMTDWKNDIYIAEYGWFKIDDEKSKYKLEVSNYFRNSTAGDSLGDEMNIGQSHNNMPFSTYDSDNDMRFYDNCAQIFKSGWWFNACFQSNLNGIYYRYSTPNQSDTHSKSKKLKQEENSQLRFLRNGIHWNSIDLYKSFKTTKLRIKRNSN